MIDPLGHGKSIYTKPDLEADPDLVEIAFQAPQATLCMTTALARHDPTDDIHLSACPQN